MTDVMRDRIECAIRGATVNAPLPTDLAVSRHGDHQFHGFCALCAGDAAALVDAVMAVVDQARTYDMHNERGRCRWCNVITSDALAHVRGPRTHRMACQFYVGPVDHRKVRELPALIGRRNECSCGTSWREEEGGCPNLSETWRGPQPAGDDDA